jgi:hypothetical protein
MKNASMTKARLSVTETEMREAVRIARIRERTATKIRSARYDQTTDTVVVALSTEATIVVPRKSIVGFAKAAPAMLAELQIVGAQETIWCDAVDDGVLLDQLLVIVAGEDTLGSLGAIINASKTSPARAVASRANGLKGGRPKKTTSRGLV